MEILVIVILIALVYYFRSSSVKAKHKGAKGESSVARKLGKLRREEYRVFNNVLLTTSWGSSQIDHVVISIYGIFVIETKNYSGWIHGNENSQNWTQTFYKKKTKFRNPVKQNWGHIYALKESLSSKVTYHPIIVFAGSAELKNVYSNTPIIYNSQLVKTIRGNYRQPLLSIEQVKRLADKLTKSTYSNKMSNRDHVRQVRNYVAENKKKVKSNICPRCEGSLVIRTGPYGKFYGCSNFPRCKYKNNYKTRSKYPS